MYNTQYETLKAIVEALAPDVEKANNNNKSAKQRLRQATLQIERHSKEFRQTLKEPTTNLEQE